MGYVFFAVRTECLNVIKTTCGFKGLLQMSSCFYKVYAPNFLNSDIVLECNRHFFIHCSDIYFNIILP
jgi:hypothetical protein